MKDIETRLKQFLVYKKIDSCRNMNEFVQTVEKLAEFSNLFPDLNADWLINGRGIMLYTPAVQIPEDIKDYSDLLDDIERITNNKI